MKERIPNSEKLHAILRKAAERGVTHPVLIAVGEPG